MTEYGSFLKTVGGGEGCRCRYPTRLDMYGCGCQHDCSYCYAKSLLGFRGLWNPSSPRIADRKKVSKALDKVPKGTVLRVGGMTDPFQPMEKEVGNTRWLIEELNSRGIGYLIVTKGDYLDSYVGNIMDDSLAHIQISVTSTGRNLEPHAPDPSERLRCADALYDMGFDTQIRLSPYVPSEINSDLIASRDCDRLLVEFLRVNSGIEKAMPWMDFSEYSVRSGGYRHLPLDRKLEYLKDFDSQRVSVCEDVPEHYEFFKNHFNPNPDNCCDLIP